MGDASLTSAIAEIQIDTQSPAPLLNTLFQRADVLLNEFKAYQAYLQQVQKSREVEARIFRRGVESEFKSLVTLTNNVANAHKDEARISEDEQQKPKRLHVLRSSNLPFYEAIWETAKTSQGVTALGKRMYSKAPGIPSRNAAQNDRATNKSALVDLVSDDGLMWTKISIATEKRLLFDIAKEGWEGYGDEPDTSDGENKGQESDTSGQSNKLELVRLAEALQVAARSIRVRYRHPTVRFVLPRLTEGVQDDVDAVIADIRATGASVHCGPQHLSPNGFESSSPFEHMLPSSHLPPLTPTLNIDCTILLALISDISHFPRDELPPSPTSKSGSYHTAILKQIESEEM